MKHMNNHQAERLAQQRESEEALRQKKAEKKANHLAQLAAVSTACAVFEEVLAKEARAEKAEGYRLALLSKNPVITCRAAKAIVSLQEVADMTDDDLVPVRIPFAALPKNAQRALVVSAMIRQGKV